MADTLQEYLVKLGWDVDNLGMNAAKNKLKSFSNQVSGMGNSIAGSFFVAGGAVVSFITTVSLAMTSLLDSTAQADLAVERFARRMWTTEENARSFLAALDAMDAEYKDIFYMTPEEYGRLMDLKNLGKSLTAPAGLQEGLKLVRDIRHEFNRLKVVANYATQWVSFYLTKFLGTDLKNIKNGFKEFNNYVMQNIPIWTEKIALFFTMIFKLGKAAVETIQRLGDVLGKFIGSLSTRTKAIGGVVLGFIGLFKMGPIGVFIAGLLTLLALLDDFYTWERGGKSLLGKTWEKLSSFQDGFFDETKKRQIDDFIGKIGKLLDSIIDVGAAIGDVIAAIGELLDSWGVFDRIWDATLTVLNTVADALQTIADLILVISGNFDKLSPDSMFRRVLALDENGNVDPLGTAGNVGKEGFDYVMKNFTSDMVKTFTNPDMLPSSIPAEWATRQAAGAQGFRPDNAHNGFGGSSRGGGFGTQTFTQENNITVTAAPGESAETTARRTASEILRQRQQYDPFK